MTPTAWVLDGIGRAALLSAAWCLILMVTPQHLPRRRHLAATLGLALAPLAAVTPAVPFLPALLPAGPPAIGPGPAPGTAGATAFPAGWLVACLAAVAVGLLARQALARLRIARVAARAELVEVPMAGRTTDVPVRMTGALDLPGLAGVWRHVILVPRTSRRWSTERWVHVLRHEEAHIRRRDPEAEAFGSAVAAVLWFLPPVWILRRVQRNAAERAADAEAVQVGGGIHGEEYAETLLDLASGTASPAGVTGWPGRSHLPGRILAVLGGDPEGRLGGRPAWGLGLLALTGLCLAGSVRPAEARETTRSLWMAASDLGVSDRALARRIERVLASDADPVLHQLARFLRDSPRPILPSD